MKDSWYIIGLCAVLLNLFVCCERQPGQSPSQKVDMPISICLPIQDQLMQRAPMRKAMSDPGTTEHFLLPNYIYIIILKKSGSDWTVWRTIERTAEDANWFKTNYTGSLETPGDSIYMFREHLELLLMDEKFEGRVYAIASAVPLTFNRTIGSITNLEQVLNLTFDVSADGIQDNLQHIYTSPYNYEKSGAYYGSFSCIDQRVPRVEMLLYHVAAKVDVMWSVADDMRIKANPAEAVRLTYLDACNLFNGNAYCFRPMENVSGAAPLATGNTVRMVRPADEGLWWEGRSYFYTIPYTTTASGKENYFPLQLLMETNASGNQYRPTIYLQVDKTSPFVPWLRATLNLSQPLAAGSAVVIGDW